MRRARNPRVNPWATVLTPASPAGAREQTCCAAGRTLERVEDVRERVDRRVVQAHLVVQVRAGGAAGGTDVADDVAALHVLSRLARVGRKMAVTRREAVAVREIDHVAVAVGPFGLDHDAIGGSADGLSDRGRNVDRVVRARLAGEWIGAPAEAVGQDAADRSDRRSRREQLRLSY